MPVKFYSSILITLGATSRNPSYGRFDKSWIIIRNFPREIQYLNLWSLIQIIVPPSSSSFPYFCTYSPLSHSLSILIIHSAPFFSLPLTPILHPISSLLLCLLPIFHPSSSFIFLHAYRYPYTFTQVPYLHPSLSSCSSTFQLTLSLIA